MIEDKPIDYKTEHNKAINKLVSLRQKHDELKEDYDYIKSLADRYFDEQIKLKKENEQLKSILKEMVRVSEYNGAISPARVKCMVYNFLEDFE